MRSLLFLLFLTGYSSSCICPTKQVTNISGLMPVYFSPQVGDTISEPPRPFGVISDVEVGQDFTFLIERERGVHIIASSIDLEPTNVAFLAMPPVLRAKVRGRYLTISTIAHNFTIDVSDPSVSVIAQIQELDITADGRGQFPANFHGYFECVDPDQGIISFWTPAMLAEPKCSR